MGSIKFLPPPPKYHNKDELCNFSYILDEEEQAKKIISYFPERLQNFTFVKIYDPRFHGWKLKDYMERVRNQGATLIILKTYEKKICGGFTNKSWGKEGDWKRDKDAFVFNLENKYTPEIYKEAILSSVYRAFSFG